MAAKTASQLARERAKRAQELVNGTATPSTSGPVGELVVDEESGFEESYGADDARTRRVLRESRAVTVDVDEGDRDEDIQPTGVDLPGDLYARVMAVAKERDEEVYQTEIVFEAFEELEEDIPDLVARYKRPKVVSSGLFGPRKVAVVKNSSAGKRLQLRPTRGQWRRLKRIAEDEYGISRTKLITIVLEAKYPPPPPAAPPRQRNRAGAGKRADTSSTAESVAEAGHG
jgi:hypothetical protein